MIVKMKENNLRQGKGITLIALIITIIVMLILVAVTITIAVNGGLFNYAREAGVKTNEVIVAEQELADLGEGMTAEELVAKYTGAWHSTADGKLTNGKYTVEIGDYINYNCYPGSTQVTYESLGTVSGYPENATNSNKQTYATPATEDACKAIKWRVIGAENGNLLVVMETPLTNYYLRGAEGYQNGISELNKISAIYGHGVHAVEGKTRSINVEDVNKLTGYDPKTAVTLNNQKYPYGYTTAGAVNTYGNKVTYYVNTENSNKISYRSTYKSGNSKYTTFRKLGETDGIPAGEEVTVESTCCYYQGSSVTSDTNILGLLFPSGKKYWLASSGVNAYGGYADWGLHVVDEGYVRGNILWYSNSGARNCCNGVRPVVSLSSDVKLKAGTAINDVTAWDFDN